MEKNQSKKLSLIMLACCLFPIILLVALPAIGITNKGGRFPVLLLYFISHIGIMMFMMRGGGHKSCHGEHDKESQ